MCVCVCVCVTCPLALQSEGDDSSPPLVFTRPEDEYLYAQCDWSYTFPVEGRPVTKDGLLAHRLVMQVGAMQAFTGNPLHCTA